MTRMSVGNLPLMIALEAGGIIEESDYRRFLLNLLGAYRVAHGPATAFDPSVQEGWLQADDWKVTGTDDESEVSE